MSCLKSWGLTFFVVLCAQQQCMAQVPNLHIHISDVGGAAIESMVYIHEAGGYNRLDPPGAVPSEDQKAKTDKFGHAIISLRPQTFYNVCAFAIGFAPSCTTLLMEQGKDKNIKILMNSDAVLCRYLCDSFPTPPSKGKH